MAANVHHLFDVFDMPPGKTWTFFWTNLPAGYAFAVDAFPYTAGTTEGGFTHTTQVEITRVWRQRREIQQQGSLGVTVDAHNDIWFEVKNVGNDTLQFDVYLTAFS